LKFYCFSDIIITFASDYHGVLKDSAEMIPIEPDAGNAVAGIFDSALFFLLRLSSGSSPCLITYYLIIAFGR
jgi:hypothetical protein